MGFFDRLFGDEPQRPESQQPRDENEIALERYRYLLRTAPPETIEQVHAEAFDKLTPEQRQLLFTQLSQNAPAGEAPGGTDSLSLAKSATRSELRNPGTMERSMAPQDARGNYQGPGFGSMIASSLLGTVAGYVIGSALVSAFMPDLNGAEGDATADGTGESGDGSTDATGDTVTSADGGGYDSGAGDSGAGDFGGGDFGGGADFGGGFDF